MDFRLLGPFEVLDGIAALHLPAGKQRALLAFLLLNANRTVALQRIVDELWGDEVPESAPKMVQIHVSQLRKALPEPRLRTRPPGYQLEVGEGELDLARFERLTDEGRRALSAGRSEDAAELLAEALGLWRGPALAEFSEPFAQHDGPRLEELRLAAVESRVQADLDLGRHAEAVGELEALILRHPLRERLRELDLLALYRSGRHAEALSAYQTYRRTLDAELGIEPSPALRELERRILAHDPALERGPRPAPPSSPSAHPPPDATAYARSGDVRIAYQVVGDGPVDLVLVH